MCFTTLWLPVNPFYIFPFYSQHKLHIHIFINREHPVSILIYRSTMEGSLRGLTEYVMEREEGWSKVLPNILCFPHICTFVNAFCSTYGEQGSTRLTPIVLCGEHSPVQHSAMCAQLCVATLVCENHIVKSNVSVLWCFYLLLTVG